MNRQFLGIVRPAPRELTNLRLVSKRWASSTSAQLFENLKVGFPTDRGSDRHNSQAFHELSANTFAIHVRHVKIIIHPSSVEAGETYDQFQDRLQVQSQNIMEALSKFPILKALSFMTHEARNLGGMTPQSQQEVGVVSPRISCRRSSNVYRWHRSKQSPHDFATLLAYDKGASTSLSLRSTLKRLTSFRVSANYRKLGNRPDDAPEQSQCMEEL